MLADKRQRLVHRLLGRSIVADSRRNVTDELEEPLERGSRRLRNAARRRPFRWFVE
jgi:hypothetical protein